MAKMNIRIIDVPCSISKDKWMMPFRSCNQPELNQTTKKSSDVEKSRSQKSQYSQQNALDLLVKEAMLLNRSRNEGFLYEITFAIHYKTVFGEKIVVTGSSDWLGNWDPLKALDLEWSGENLWSNLIFLSEGSIDDLEYKYVCVTSNYCRWEQGKNRTLKPSDAEQFGHKLVFKKQDIWDK